LEASQKAAKTDKYYESTAQYATENLENPRAVSQPPGDLAITKKNTAIYYRLKDKYSLRGWELLPYAIVDRDAHLAKFVEKETFDALSLCDASVDIDLPLVPRSIRDAIKKQAEQGVVSLYP
jgi:hypothetical protein